MKTTLLFIISMFFAVNVYGQDKDKIFQEFEVAQNAEFPGGINNFRTLIQNKISLPANTQKKCTEGRCIIEFVIDKNGKMEDFKSVKKLGHGCDEAAIDAIKSLNTNYTWKPARNQEGKPIKVRKSIPVNFKWNDTKKTNPLESK